MQFVPSAAADAVDIELRKVDETADARAHLGHVLHSVSDGPLPALNFATTSNTDLINAGQATLASASVSVALVAP